MRRRVPWKVRPLKLGRDGALVEEAHVREWSRVHEDELLVRAWKASGRTQGRANPGDRLA